MCPQHLIVPHTQKLPCMFVELTLKALDLGLGNPGTRTRSAINVFTSATELLSVPTIFFL